MASQAFIRFLTDAYGQKEISSAIGKLRRRLDDLRPVLEDIGQVYTDSTKLRISSQTTPQGRTWKHNSFRTQQLKEKGMKGRGKAIEGKNKRLVWTGKLRSSIKYRVSGNTVIVAADVPYAPLMQFGAPAGMYGLGRVNLGSVSPARAPSKLVGSPWGDVPARPFLGSNKKTNEQVMTILGNYLLGNQVAKKIGFSS